MNISSLQAIADRFLRGEISAQVATMEFLLRTRDADTVARALALLEGDPNRIAELRAMFAEHATNCARIATLLKMEMDVPVSDGQAALERVRHLFDTAARESEEASVALYSLGSPSLLAEATREAVDVLQDWGVLGSDRCALDIGCGIGRFLESLAPRLRRVVGIDVSVKMLEAARLRLRDVKNVELSLTDGRNLSEFEPDSFDLVYAIDVLPYVVELGRTCTKAYFREVSRVLTLGGDFVIFNYAYARSNADNLAEVRELAGAAGLALIRANEMPFRIWNGVGFLLRKRTH